MSLPILASKLYIPRFDALIARPHLFERLNDGLSRRLILVAASAGFGKTSLVSAWLREVDLPAAWLSLDATDSDPPHFISYFVAACQQIEPTIGQSVPDLLQSPQSPSLETMMTLIINDITTTATQWLLVLDDYHLIEDISIHQVMRFLLDHLPPHLHLVIITREDPPFPLPQLRVRRQMVELRANDLRFTLSEIIEFFNKTAQASNLSPEDIAVLERRTEGWVAGLQLAALSLQNIPDPTEFIKDFAGDDRYVVDYLITEVLEQQPPHILNFLQQTSILKRFTVDLCQAVTGQANVAEILAYLEEANLFLVAQDNRREWYRYHHLFGDLLYYRLKQTSPTEIPKLHVLASRWYNQQGFTEDAIDHALTGEDYDFVADLIEEVGLKMIGRSRLNQLYRWIEALPSELIRERPYLSVLLAWITVLNRQPDPAENHLTVAESVARHLPPDFPRKPEIMCQITMLYGYVARLRYDLRTSIAHIQQAIQFLPDNNGFLQCTAYLNLGGNYWFLGNFAEVEPPIQKASAFLNFPETIYPALAATGYLTNTYLQQGKLNKAAKLGRSIQLALASHRRPPPALAYVALEQGALLYEQNELSTATEYLSQAIELGKNLDGIVNVGRALLVLAHIKHIQGQGDEVTTLVEQANANRPPNTTEFDYHQVRLWLVQGNFEAARQWAEAYDQQRGTNRPWHGLNELTFACVLLADNQVERALDIVTACETDARTAGIMGWVIRGLALKALCHQAINNTELALSSLQQALTLAQPEGYCRLFIDCGPSMQHLLQQAAVQNIAPAYVSQLLAGFPGDEAGRRGAGEQGSNLSTLPLIESLNERENSVLCLMAAGLSNREIADELYLSVNTVKWYSTQIYGKLGVKKRAEAIDRAHELGIL